jgi:hypothetical protein
MPMQIYNTPFASRIETGPQRGGPGGAVDISSVDGGFFWISGTTSQGSIVDVS